MDIQWGAVATELGGGLALFLYGMRRMTEALKVVAGGGMKKLLASLTSNRFTAALAGAVITAVIQSSSVTTVLVVGFVSAGLLTLAQSIGVILGANVGTTITAQIVAFAIYKYGLLMIGVGFFTEILARSERIRQWAQALMGLGLIFFGMELMSIATDPLRQWPPFTELLQNMRNPLLAVAVGAMFTAIVQSSSATTGITIVLASQGLITLESGIGLIFGANIGTCATGFISAFGRPREALQAAWAHAVFNVAGVLLWILFVPQFADFVRAISPVTDSLHGLDRLAADTPRQIANAHTLFNGGNLLLFIWFVGPLARLVQRIVPPEPQPETLQPRYLDDFYLEQPSLAIDQARRELADVGRIIREMLQRSLQVVTAGSDRDADQLAGKDDDVDMLYGATILFLGRLSQRDLIEPQPAHLANLVGIANYLEAIGDVIEKDLLRVRHELVANALTVSPSTLDVITPLAEATCAALDQALKALDTGNLDSAIAAIESKATINALTDQATGHLARRLVAQKPDRLRMFQLETDIIENYRRINTYLRRIARLVVASSEVVGAEAGAPVENST